MSSGAIQLDEEDLKVLWSLDSTTQERPRIHGAFLLLGFKNSRVVPSAVTAVFRVGELLEGGAAPEAARSLTSGIHSLAR